MDLAMRLERNDVIPLRVGHDDLESGAALHAGLMRMRNLGCVLANQGDIPQGKAVLVLILRSDSPWPERVSSLPQGAVWVRGTGWDEPELFGRLAVLFLPAALSFGQAKTLAESLRPCSGAYSAWMSAVACDGWGCERSAIAPQPWL